MTESARKELVASGVRMKNLLIQADKGMDSVETEGVAIKNLTLLTKDVNPLIDVRDSRRLTIDHLKYKPGAELPISVTGGASRDIKLLNTDVSNAERDFQAAIVSRF